MKRWWRNRNRTSWIYCTCGHDLNGDNDSFVTEGGTTGFYYYECAKCGEMSAWDLSPPVPIRIRPAVPQQENPSG